MNDGFPSRSYAGAIPSRDEVDADEVRFLDVLLVFVEGQDARPAIAAGQVRDKEVELAPSLGSRGTDPAGLDAAQAQALRLVFLRPDGRRGKDYYEKGRYNPRQAGLVASAAP